MRRRFQALGGLRRAMLVLLVWAGLAFMIQCGERDAAKHATVDAVPLAIEAHLPEGETQARHSVDVVFDRPMARLGDAAPSFERGRNLLRLEPQPNGNYAWIGTRTLSFTAPRGLPAATAFRAVVPAGTVALDGAALTHDVAWEFSTARPQLVASVPAAGDVNFPPGDPIVLQFNIPMDLQAVQHAATLEGVTSWRAGRADSTLLRSLDARFWAVDADRIVVLRPTPALGPDRAYELQLGVGLRSQAGPLGPAETIRIGFRTYGPPGLEAVRAEGGGVLRLEFRTPVDPDSARAWIRLEPDPSGSLNAWSDANKVYLAGDLGFEKSYVVTARAGLPDHFGQRLTASQTFQVTTPKREPTLQLLPSEAVLLPETPRTVALVYCGMGPVQVRARRILAADEIRLRTQPLGAGGRWTYEEKFPAGADPGRVVNATLDLGALLPASRLGAILVEARATEQTTTGRPGQEWQVRSVLRWSDVGSSFKIAPENGLVWVTRSSSAKPIAAANLRILDDKVAVLWRGKSDAQGMAKIPGLLELKREPWQLSLAVASGPDTALSSLQPDWRLDPWRFGIPGAYGSQENRRAFLYADRDLYRPGESIRIAGLVRRTTTGGLATAGLDSLQIWVRDPVGRAFATRSVPVDRHGGFALDLPTTSTATVGRYWIEVGLRRAGTQRGESERRTIGSLGVELAAFRAAAFRTEVRPRTASLFPGGQVAARVNAAYYFGAPIAGAPFNWTAVRQRVDFHPRGFDAYAFDDPELETSYGGVLASGNSALGDSGTAFLKVALPPEIPATTQAIHVEATVHDPSGDAVSGRASVLYHPTHIYAGVAVQPSFVDLGQAITARVVAVRADTAAAIAGTTIDVELVRRDWRSVRKLLVGGRVGFETTSIDSTVETREVTSSLEPVELRFTPPAAGSYRVRVRARDGERHSPAGVVSFWVAGARPGAWRAEDAIRLEMTSDRNVYNPGDVARILVTTPVNATRALLTIEREGLLESRLVDLEGNAPVLEIPVKPEYLPNVYVGLAAVERALTAKEAPSLPEPARLPRYVMGYVALRVEVAPRRLGVEVAADRSEYRPGDQARIDVQVRDAAGAGRQSRVGVAVVDEAVLALLGSAVPDPFEFFYQERPLATANGDTRLRLSAGSRLEAAKFKGEAGGDGAERLAARSLFTTTAYWNPAVETDSDGHARIEFALPDNLTRFRVVAIAASGNELFGSGRNAFRVAKPLTIDPALPRFALEGDTLEVAAVVTNRTAARQQGRVQLETELEPMGNVTQSVTLAPNTSKRVAFRTRAARAGAAKVRFEAHFPAGTDAVEVRLPIDAPRIERGGATAAHTSATAVERVAVPVAAIPGTAALDVSLAASALGGARPAFDYVVDYPYGCLEQLASRLVVLVTARDLFVPTGTDSVQAVTSIERTIDAIESASPPWGGFSFWRGGPEPETWLTAYVAFALGRASKAGFAVDANVLQNAQFQVTQAWRSGRNRGAAETSGGDSAAAAARQAEKLWWAEQPAGLGLLALSEMVKPEPQSVLEPADVDYIVDHAADLAEDERLFLALALDNWSLRHDFVERTFDAAMQRLQVTGGGATLPAPTISCWPIPFRTATRNTSLALWLATRIRSRDKMVLRLAGGLLGMRAGGHWNTTQDDALALLALASYRDRVERATGNLDATVHWQGTATPLVSLAAPAGTLERRERTLQLPADIPGSPASPGALDAGLEFATQGLVHYTAELSWEEEARNQPPVENGYSIVRRIERFEGKGTTRLGDLVVVTLTLVVPRDSWYLAIVDPLPGGLEIVQNEFQVESRGVASQLDRWPEEHPPLPVSFTERRDRELRVFADEVRAGVYQHRYIARVRAVGGFVHLPARIEAMYSPELHASTPAARWRARGPAKEARR